MKGEGLQYLMPGTGEPDASKKPLLELRVEDPEEPVGLQKQRGQDAGVAQCRGEPDEPARVNVGFRVED